MDTRRYFENEQIEKERTDEWFSDKSQTDTTKRVVA